MMSKMLASLRNKMCNTCSSRPDEHYENWLTHHLPDTSSHVRVITDNDLAIDAILAKRLDSFSIEEIQELYSVDEDKAHDILFIINNYLSKIEDILLDSISK